MEKAHIISRLQTDILRLQGYKSCSNATVDAGLGPIKEAFPNATFPLGAVHEFLPAAVEDTAAASGFVAGLLASLMGKHGTSLWISSSGRVFPPALQSFGVVPDRVIFVVLRQEKEVMWAVEEALKCGALAAVVGEVKDLDFTFTRRLQLVVEQSQVTGLMLRANSRQLNTTACVSRWKISSLPAEPLGDLPGIGFPQWKVELMRVRNGKPGAWDIKWANGKFQPVYKLPSMFLEEKKKAG